MRIAFRLAACLLLALGPSGCAYMDPHNIIGRQLGSATPVDVVPQARAAPLTPEGRAQAFDFVWHTVNDRYHDAALNGVDWKAAAERFRPIAMAAPDDEAFWDALDRMTGELKDSHTRVDSPRRALLRRRDETISLGFSFARVDGKLAVTSVSPEADAWWAGVRSGMLLVAIDGQPAAQAYERLMADTRMDSTDRSRHFRAVRRLVAGEENSSVPFTFERADGSRFEATLKRRRISTRASAMSRVLPSGYGYVRLTQWTLGATATALQGMDALKDTPGLIVDLRGNPGGAVHAVNMLLERFFSKPTELGRATTRTGRPVSLLFGTVEVIRLARSVQGSPYAYAKPVIVLVNAQSASGSELFAGAMQAVGRATVMGETTCGCLLGFLGYAPIPGGGDLAYSEVGFVMTNGRKVEGRGVEPDVVVAPSLADLQLARDRVLEAAQEHLRSIAARG